MTTVPLTARTALPVGSGAGSERAADGSGHEQGVVAVEFALVSMLFLMLLFAILTFGLLFGLNHTLTHAAAEGARSALTAPAGAVTSTAEDAARSRLAWLGEGATVSATTAPCESDPAMQCVVVSAHYDYAAHPFMPPLPGLGLVVPDRFTRVAVLQISQVASP